MARQMLFSTHHVLFQPNCRINSEFSELVGLADSFNSQTAL